MIDRLKCDSALRRLCGWSHAKQIPSKSKFSRAFAQFAASQLPQQMQAAFVAATQKGRIIGHIARDSTAIPTREHAAEARLDQKRQAKKRQTRKSPQKPKPRRAKAADRGPRIERQLHQKLDVMVAALPKACDIRAKRNSQRHNNYWRGHELHIDVADGQIPISALLTSASVHDSQGAIPLMKLTSSRVTYLYDLMDLAYYADRIKACSRRMNHAPIITVHSRRGTKKASELTKVFPAKPAPELSWAERERFKERTMVERVNARLKDELGASRIRVRGAEKGMAHLMDGLVALGVDQWLRLKSIRPEYLQK